MIPLTEDEAYYRLWAQSLQLGYYDHPPMIAWWIAAGMRLAGDTALGVRLLPALSAGLVSLLIFDLAQRLGAAEGTAVRAAVWFNATLLVGAGGFLATPDAAAVPFWTLTVWCLARTDGERAARWWLAAGVAAGLACLSKYSALFLAPGVLLWLALSRDRFKVLLTHWPWLAALTAGLIFGANVAWNADHQWVSFVKQFGRAAPGRFAPQYLIELLAGQFLLLNPLIAWHAARGMAGAWRRPRAPGAIDLTLLLATTAPFAAYLIVHSLHDRVQAHWPVPLYPALAIAASVAAERVSTHGVVMILRRAAVPLGLAISALVLFHAAAPITDLKSVRDPVADLKSVRDPVADIRGWPEFARRIEALRRAHHAEWFGTFSYGTTAQLAAQSAVTAPVVELVERARYPAADRSWRAPLGRPGLVVDLDRRVNAASLKRCFATVISVGELKRDLTGYSVFVVSGPKPELIREGCDRP